MNLEKDAEVQFEIRSAAPEDAEAVGAIQADGWRSIHRGVVTDAFLDGVARSERVEYWRRCLASGTGSDWVVLVAQEAGTCVGFICIRLWAEPAWGPLLDNLYVKPDHKGQGIGGQLIHAALAWAGSRGPFQRWHLWVVETNHSARRVYEHLGWQPQEREVRTAPDGTEYSEIRYVQSLTLPGRLGASTPE